MGKIDGKPTVTTRVAISADGKTMTDVRTISEGGGDDRVLKLVFGRQ